MPCPDTLALTSLPVWISTIFTCFSFLRIFSELLCRSPRKPGEPNYGHCPLPCSPQPMTEGSWGYNYPSPLIPLGDLYTISQRYQWDWAPVAYSGNLLDNILIFGCLLFLLSHPHLPTRVSFISHKNYLHSDPCSGSILGEPTLNCGTSIQWDTTQQWEWVIYNCMQQHGRIWYTRYEANEARQTRGHMATTETKYIIIIISPPTK